MRLVRVTDEDRTPAPVDSVVIPDDLDTLEAWQGMGYDVDDHQPMIVMRHPDTSVGLTFVREADASALAEEGYEAVSDELVVRHEGRLMTVSEVPDDVVEVLPAPVGDGYWLIHGNVVDAHAGDDDDEGDPGSLSDPEALDGENLHDASNDSDH